MERFPEILNDTSAHLAETLRRINLLRNDDIGDWDDLPNRYMRGRKVEKVPTSSSDTASTDRAGDFNYSASFFYLCVNNAGTIVWRRIALSSW
jgi:hypothetical protein